MTELIDRRSMDANGGTLPLELVETESDGDRKLSRGSGRSFDSVDELGPRETLTVKLCFERKPNWDNVAALAAPSLGGIAANLALFTGGSSSSFRPPSELESDITIGAGLRIGLAAFVVKGSALPWSSVANGGFSLGNSSSAIALEVLLAGF